MSPPAEPGPTEAGPAEADLDRLRARVAELEAENARLEALVVQWRAVGLEGWTEPDPVVPLDDLTTLKNLVARCVLAPLRATKRAVGRLPVLRRAAVRAQVAVQARARRR